MAGHEPQQPRGGDRHRCRIHGDDPKEHSYLQQQDRYQDGEGEQPDGKVHQFTAQQWDATPHVLQKDVT